MAWTKARRAQQAERLRKQRQAWMSDPVHAERVRQHARDLCGMMHDDPAIVAKQRANYRAAMVRLASDPAWRARMGYLPPMTAAERRFYRKLTSNGATRADALKLMGKDELGHAA